MKKEDALQVLNQLYGATRRAPLSADDHEQLLRMAEDLAKFLQELPEEVK